MRQTVDPRNRSGKTPGPTPAKAAEMMQDGTAHGKPLTKKQRGLFGAIMGGSAMGKQCRGKPGC